MPAIDFWSFSLSCCDEVLASAERLLSPPEQERATRFRFDRHRRRFVVRRAMRRVLLAHLVDAAPSDLQFGEAGRGKPRVIGDGIEFNASHTGDVGVIVTGQAPLGVDIEALDRPLDYLRFAQHSFTEEEFLDIGSCHGDDLPLAFFNCWTGKEAYIKAIGLGLSKDLRSFSVLCAPDTEPGLRWDRESYKEARDWRFARISSGNHIATVVYGAAGTPGVRSRQLGTESLRAGVPVQVD